MSEKLDFYCDYGDHWVPMRLAALTGCHACFAHLHSSNFPERQLQPSSTRGERDILGEHREESFSGDGGPK